MNKGQIANLDLFIAILVFTVAIGYLLQIASSQQYIGLKELSNAQLRMVAENAGDLLVGNPDIECKLVDNDSNTKGDITYLVNTINPQINVKKSDLGIPSEYKCNVSGINVINCADKPSFYDNVYTVTRQIKVPDTAEITTRQLKKHALGKTISVTIKVWK